MTQRKLTISATELQMFGTCRRRWYLSRLYSSRLQAPALMFGSAIHKGLEGYFLAKKSKPDDPKFWKGTMLALYLEFINEERKRSRKEYGMLYEQASESLEELYELGRKVLINYCDYDREAEIQIAPTLVEKRLFIPLDARGRNVLTMRWDALAVTNDGLTAIVDHKTVGGSLNTMGTVLDLDEQMTEYAYGYWRIHERDRTVDMIIYDKLAKKIPAPIKVLKSGKLSTDKSQDTILPILMQAIAEFKDDVDRFYDLISVLEEKGWGNYFQREASQRNVEQLKNFENRAFIIFDEMRACIENPRLAYPSPGPIKCQSCPFKDVCLAMEDGSNADYLLQTAYVRDAKTPWTLPARFSEMTG